jgi:DNA processing protein
MTQLEYWLALLHAPALGTRTFHTLLNRFGTPQAVFAAGDESLKQCGLKPETRRAINNFNIESLQLDLDWAAADNHHIITLHDTRYPALLKSLDDAPPVLYVRGDPDYLQQPQLAMVGSRTPTAAGRRCAKDFARYLSDCGITITSGLAHGIDGASHEGALAGLAGTVALVAHGLDIVYPAAHRKLAEAISRHGAIVSEVPIGTAPLKGLFPRRNRIISGLSLGTLVVEAALNSGSLITAREALQQGREIFAIPGSIHNPLARGCHRLIRDGAKLVETANDILEELGALLPQFKPGAAVIPPEPAAEKKLDPDHQKLLKCLAYEPAPIDELVNRSGFTASEVASMLLILELEGSVASDGGLYSRVS